MFAIFCFHTKENAVKYSYTFTQEQAELLLNRCVTKLRQVGEWFLVGDDFNL